MLDTSSPPAAESPMGNLVEATGWLKWIALGIGAWFLMSAMKRRATG